MRTTLTLSLGRRIHSCRISPTAKSCFCSFIFLFPRSKNCYRESIWELGLFRHYKSFVTTDPEWERAAQAFWRAWNKGTEQFCAHRRTCVSPWKQNWRYNTLRAFGCCLYKRRQHKMTIFTTKQKEPWGLGIGQLQYFKVSKILHTEI